MISQMIGEVRVDRIVETQGPFAEASFLLPDFTPELIAQHRDWLVPRYYDDAQDRVIMSFHSLLLRTPRYNILVDTCVGNDKHRPARPGWHLQQSDWLSRLAVLQLAPEQIDYVFCTHLHADHVGWNTRLVDGRWVPTFPNARYLFARTEYEYWQQAIVSHRGEAPLNHGCFADSVLPVVEAGQVELIDNDYQFDESIRFSPAPGHTPGMVVVHVDSRGQRALLTGDVMHTPIQLACPVLSSRFCLDPQRSRQTRRALIEQCADSDVLLLPAHFPDPTAGYIRRRGDAFCYRDAAHL